MEDIAPNYEKAIYRAERVLQENFVAEPPVDVIEVAKNYGIDVKSIVFSDNILPDVAGFMDIEESTIYLNDRDSDERKAFTVAHELGHWFLHHDSIVNEPERSIVFRTPIGKKSTDPREKEVNCFAAHLLVPRSMLERYKDEEREIIARIFGVSTDVIGYRLSREYGE